MAHNWDEDAAKWESNQATGEFAEQAFAQLTKLINLSGKRVIDFGCGTGLLSQKISPLAKEIVALDSSELMIEELDKKMLINVEPVVDQLTRGLIAQHPAFRGQFDCVVASSVCGFLEDYQEAATLVYSLLEEDGMFVHWDWLASEGEEGLTEKQAKKTLTKAGFNSVAISVPFEITSEQGTLKVLMAVGQK
ncbi:class I SAM-dependent DNA methyltransferase [Vibrio sp. SCSIO 43137]|uniref:class I SAM-dependent DNA methyltransferase n=1 Tax=Vibrio sp. SCSIO 43137 TaxID=3021011 RepID=UPI002307F969|nr:class I SAM-dependent methyltransferase [Vibrio sp. SCSIO 43137]WCE32373.1 class I SAM-dependent methyltransferase [Vibrio sp. SCSIO 43137]